MTTTYHYKQLCCCSALLQLRMLTTISKNGGRNGFSYQSSILPKKLPMKKHLLRQLLTVTHELPHVYLRVTQSFLRYWANVKLCCFNGRLIFGILAR